MGGHRSTTLLILDDDPLVLRAVQHLVVGAGYRACAFTSCTAAEADLERCDPDLVISDYALTDGDGISFLRRVRERAPRAKTLLLSASVEPTWLRAHALACGIHAFAKKPWTNTELLQMIRDLLEK